MEYNELMQRFAGKFSIDSLAIEDGASALEIDGMTVGFIHDEAADAIMVVAEIGYPPPDADGPFGSAMLKANYLFGGTDGATLCQNPDTGAYAVMRTWPLAAHDDDTFAAAVEGLMNTAERWREVLDGIREAEEAAEMAELEDDGQDEGDVPGEISLGGFMQV